MTNAIGIIETRSVGSVLFAANSALNFNGIKLLGIEETPDGYMIAFISGDYPVIKKSLEFCSQIAAQSSFYLNSRVITNPDKKLLSLITKNENDLKTPVIKTKKKISGGMKPSVKSETKKLSNSSADKIDEGNVQEKRIMPESESMNTKVSKKTKMENPVSEIKKNINNDAELKISGLEIEKNLADDNPTIKRLKLEALGKRKNNSELKTETPVKNISPVEVEILTLKQLEELNVHKLRKYARSYEGFPIKGREISKANRGELLNYFKDLV